MSYVYEIRRYGKYNYGERLYTYDNLRDCLKYLKDMVERNDYVVERHGYTFVTAKNLYRIYKAQS